MVDCMRQRKKEIKENEESKMMICDGKKNCTRTPRRLKIWLAGDTEVDHKKYFALIDLCTVCQEMFENVVGAQINRMKEEAKP